MKYSYSYYIQESNDNKSPNDIYILLRRKEKNSQLNNKAFTAIRSMKKSCIEKVVNKEKQKAPRRILSNERDKFEYSEACPSPLRKILKDAKGDIEVSDIHSKKLFDLCAKFAQSNLKLPEVNSPRVKYSEKSKCGIKFIQKRKICSPRLNLETLNLTSLDPKKVKEAVKQNEFEESDNSEINHSNYSSRILNKEECEVNYRAINERMRNKILEARLNKFQLFTFNPLKLRLKSPETKRENLI